MKQLCSILFLSLFSLFVHSTWGQASDSSGRKNTVVTDRINEPADRLRGPSLNKLQEMADEAFLRHNYFASSQYYAEVLKSEPGNIAALKGYGEASLLIAALDNAESAFQRMVNMGASPAPDYFPKLRLAEVKFQKGDYDGAIVILDEILSAPQAPALTPAALAEAQSRKHFCEWALEVSHNPDVVKESFRILDSFSVNTAEYAEYMSYPDEADQKIYFSAYRFEYEKDRSRPKRNLIKLMTAPMSGATQATIMDSGFNDPEKQHTAHIAFSESRNTVYFAQGDFAGKTADIQFDLYRRKKDAEGKWGAPEKLNAVNAPGYTTTQPALGTLPGDKFETLFFVSDRPGGMGGRDIWYSSIIGDSLTAPLPLNLLNTKGDEVTPFYHAPSNNLFFSTNGGVTARGDSLRTIGGFDVYKAKCGPGGKWAAPRHMGMPINSYANDVYFSMTRDSRVGYLSNNLRGNPNNKEEGCCYDIYTVDFIQPTVTAVGKHKLTRKILPFTNITLLEASSTGKYVPIANPQADSTSTHVFEVGLGKKYMLIGNKTAYASDTLYFETPDEVWHDDLVLTLYLKPYLNLVVNVFEEDSDEGGTVPLPGATLSFFDLGGENDNGEFVPSETKKVTVLPANTNRNVYPLEYGRRYQVLGSKEGYRAYTAEADSSKVISTVGLTTGGNIEVDLYLHKPSVLETYLPITLYFDNDYPKKDYPPSQDTILLDYQKTFVNYIRKKEEYKTEFSKGLVGAERQAALDSIEFFFEKQVRVNWDSFFAFSDKIELMLERGDTVILTLKGYASPLSNPTYNYHLTNRRIASVYNHFMIFDGEIFKPYREGSGTGQLRFKREANGDSEAPKDMNKDPKNRRLSVYDYRTSRERRVQIIGARVSKSGKRDDRL
jgi:tetratricopeptide (TPR) repeat protein